MLLLIVCATDDEVSVPGVRLIEELIATMPHSLMGSTRCNLSVGEEGNYVNSTLLVHYVIKEAGFVDFAESTTGFRIVSLVVEEACSYFILE